jgi:hypothetical protein
VTRDPFEAGDVLWAPDPNLAAKDLTLGGPSKPSWIDMQTLITIKHSWTGGYIGRVVDAQTNRARRIVKGFF